MTVNAKAVILATGGFGANLDMVAELVPALKGFMTTNAAGAQGQGIEMAQALGAATVDMDQIQIHPTVQFDTAALLMNYIIQPVYTFPEWIPTVLVEWKDIAKAFWNVWQDTAVMQELRTPEILRLRWLALLVQGCSAGAGVLLGILYGRMRSSRQLVADSVNALYHQGATVSVIHTRKVIDMTDLGYVITLDGEIIPRRAKTVPMVRIINAEAILRQMPAGKRDGAFVLEVVDEQIPANNARWLITCQDGEKTIVEANRDWDIQLPIAVLTRIVYGTQTFADFLECNAGYDMRMRSPAMDGMFGHHLTIDGGEK